MLRILILTLLLTACGKSDFYNLVGHRRFKVGDCLISSLEEPEEWQITKPEYKVLKLGKKSYLTKNIEKGYEEYNIMHEIKYGHLWEDYYQKVPCQGAKK